MGLPKPSSMQCLLNRSARTPDCFSHWTRGVKVVSMLALLIGVSLSHSLLVIAAGLSFAFTPGLEPAIPVGFFIKLRLAGASIFTGLVVIPALFITPGPALLHLPLGLVITQRPA